MTKQKNQQSQEAIDYLKENIVANMKIYYLVMRVSKSGMSRRIRFFISIDGEIQDISFFVARSLDYAFKCDEGVLLKGCGMDMGYHVVTQLSHVLFGNYDSLKMRSM